MTLKQHQKLVNKKNYKRILTFMFPVLYSPNGPIYFLGFFTSASVHADPGGMSLCGSVRIRIQNIGSSLMYI